MPILHNVMLEPVDTLNFGALATGGFHAVVGSLALAQRDTYEVAFASQALGGAMLAVGGACHLLLERHAPRHRPPARAGYAEPAKMLVYGGALLLGAGLSGRLEHATLGATMTGVAYALVGAGQLALLDYNRADGV